MIYPRLNTIPASRSMTNVFGGYDHRTVISEGSFFDMKNLSSDKYPVLSNRKRRGIFKSSTGGDDPTQNNNITITGVISKDTLCYTRYSTDSDSKKGEFVICNEDGSEKEAIDLGLDSKKKQLVSMGAYVVIFPDKKYINTANPSRDNGDLVGTPSLFKSASKEETIAETDKVTYSMCDEDGTAFTQDNTQLLSNKNFSNPNDYEKTSGPISDEKKYCVMYNEEKIPTAYYTRVNNGWWGKAGELYVRIDINNAIFESNKKYLVTGIDAIEWDVIFGESRSKISINISKSNDETTTAIKGERGFFVIRGSFSPLPSNDIEDEPYLPELVKQNTDKKLTVSILTSTVSATLCDINGDDIVCNTGAPLPDKVSNGQYFLYLSTPTTGAGAEPRALYKGIGDEWVKQTPYIKIKDTTQADLGERFLRGDLVGITTPQNVTTDNTYVDIKGNNIVAVGSNWLAFEGMAYTIDELVDIIFPSVNLADGTEIRVALKSAPDMDFVIEAGNRLWGCKYDTLDGEKKVNAIYASKLGDFKRWYSFAGTSQDSYEVSVGSDGPFTGAVAYLGHPTFFKEDRIYKIYGSYPSNYQVNETECRGIEPGSEKSIAAINEVLFFKSRSGICKYDGSLPVSVSEPFGDRVYSNAVGGMLGNKYYVCMKDTATLEDLLFVYDAAKGLWHKEDSVTITDFAHHKGELYGVEYDNDRIISMGGSTGVLDDSDAVSFMAETGIIGTDMPDKKYISKLDIRMSLEVGHKVKFSIEYDSSGEWTPLFYMSGTPLGSFSVPIMPNRCDHFRLRIEGDGEVRIFSICKTVEQGGE